MNSRENTAGAHMGAGTDFVQAMYREHVHSVFARCLMMGRGRVQWAEDVTHDVFVRLIEEGDKVRPELNVGAWLRAVAYRICLDRLRREGRIWRKVQDALLASPPVHPEPLETLLHIKSRFADLQVALSALPHAERAVLAMKHVDGMAQHEIASALGCSQAYVSQLVKRATARLKKQQWMITDG